ARLGRGVGVGRPEGRGRRVPRTGGGKELLDHASRIDGAIAAALEALAPHARGEAGRLRLGTGGTASIYLLPPVLRALRQRFPRLEIVMTTGNTPEIVADIEHNRLDLGFVTLPASGRMLQVTPVLDDELVAITSRDGVRLPAKLTAAALAEPAVITSEVGSNSRLVTDQWFARAGVAFRPATSLANTQAIRELVAAGLGCAILPRLALRGAT